MPRRCAEPRIPLLNSAMNPEAGMRRKSYPGFEMPTPAKSRSCVPSRMSAIWSHALVTDGREARNPLPNRAPVRSLFETHKNMRRVTTSVIMKDVSLQIRQFRAIDTRVLDRLAEQI